MIQNQRSAQIKGDLKKKKKGRKGLVSRAGGCQGCFPKETLISPLSQIRNGKVHLSPVVWYHVRPWLSKQAPSYYVSVRPPGFSLQAESSSPSQTCTKNFSNPCRDKLFSIVKIPQISEGLSEGVGGVSYRKCESILIAFQSECLWEFIACACLIPDFRWAASGDAHALKNVYITELGKPDLKLYWRHQKGAWNG